jgi:hypothetical protein
VQHINMAHVVHVGAGPFVKAAAQQLQGGLLRPFAVMIGQAKQVQL